MKRLRLVFLGLAVVLLVPLGLLVRKALTSAAAERTAEHRAVAERVLDEMERELSSFLTREEARPFEHYRHTYLAGTTGAAPRRSPLAATPAESFLLGYFQLDADGTFRSPHVPETPSVPPPTDVADWVAHVEEVVRFVWKREEAAAAEVQSAGSTMDVRTKAQALKKLPQERYLESLNRAARTRELRPSKTEQTQLLNVMIDDAEADERFDPADDAVVDVRLEPFVARSAGAGLDLLVLYRTVWVGEGAYRQGLLVDTAALLEELSRRVLRGSELASHLSLGLAEDRLDDGGVYSYRHRFAEPFGKVTALLVLEPLPELQGTAMIYSLSLLLALAASLGLFAVYRMTAVVVEFAERRHNFVSAVTHELKTPLTAIRMYGEMLRDGVVPDESKRHGYYVTITAEAERLTRLLQNVLELSRLEKGHRTTSASVGEVGSVLDDAVTVLGPHAEKEGFVLRVEREEGLPEVRYDRDALLQVLLNLVDNALKYSRQAATKEIVLRARRVEDGVAVSVADRGPGVDREHLGKIFEPFYRGGDELTRTTKGTGIGLALVRGLVERMGGSVRGGNVREGGFEVTISLAAA